MSFSKNFELSTLDGINGFVFNGVSNSERSGTSVSSAGDVNGDGIDDLIIGAPYADSGDRHDTGGSYVVYGKTTGFDPSFDLANLSEADGFLINGVNEGDLTGHSVSSAGDVNGDGVDDLIIGAPYADSNNQKAGASYVVYGKTTGFGGSLDLASLDGNNGFTIKGIDYDDVSGWSVSGAGDVNGDGLSDLIIGAYGGDPGEGQNAGESYVVFGKNTGFAASLELSYLDGTNGFVINGVDANDFAGRSVSSAGDVNGDGVDDLIIGANGADPLDNAGESYVVFGKKTGFDASLELSHLDGTNGFVLNGASQGDYSGTSVSSAGDVNGDGIDDLIIGAYRTDSASGHDVGASYVVFGKNTGFAASLELSHLDGTNGFVINGVDAEDFTGTSVSSAGDVNGDGIDDLIIGASGADPNGNLDAGASYVVFGKNTGFAASLELSALDGTDGLVINGVGKRDYSGSSVRNAGDVNGDGVDDLIIGAHNANSDSNVNTGKSFVVLSLQTNTNPEIATNSEVSVAENNTLAVNIDTNDSNTENAGLSYSLSGGEDQALFSINETTGELNFLSAPNFEAPLDTDADNNYQVQVTVTDAGGLTGDQDLSITVTDVNNTPEEIQEEALLLLDTDINRFQNQDVPGTYLYAGEEESQQIRENFPNFVEEGLAFRVADEPEGDLLSFYRFQSTTTPGTYLYAGEGERASINENFSESFVEEGFAFAAYGCGSGVGDAVYRFQNSDRPGTYLFAGAEERTSILANFPNFVEEGCAFHVDL